MSVAQLVSELALVAHVEIVVALLPEVLDVTNRPARDALLQGFDRVRQSSALWLTQQQMHTLPAPGHEPGAAGSPTSP